MASRKRFHRYPHEYVMLISRAYDSPQSVPCRTPEQAQAFRRELYNWRAALRELTTLDDAVIELKVKADALSFSVSNSRVRIQRTDYASLIAPGYNLSDLR